MQLRFAAILAGLGFTALVAQSCSDEAQTTTQSTATSTATTGASGGQGGMPTTTTTSTGGSGGVGGQGGSGGAPPITCDFIPTTGVVLAVNKVLLGNKDPNGMPNLQNGWKQYGFNLDGFVSTAQSQGLCLPVNGAAPSGPYPDGDNGIDNSFGKNILPLILAIVADADVQMNDSINAGNFTLMLHLVDLVPTPDQNPLLARFYEGAVIDPPPVFNGTDCWPVNPASLWDPLDITSSKAVFPQSSLSSNAWASGTPTTLSITLNFGGFPLPLTLYHARFSFNLSANHTTAINGQLGGILDTNEFVLTAENILGAYDANLCCGPTKDAIINQVRQASDILVDGSQNPNLTCNGISLGLGFTMAAVNLEGVALPSPPLPDPCPNPCP